ncbi:tryptophan synthase beta subunit-like PLP-dependent enzyme [Periconia macrospinosa]|uniref:L-serine ammonia-lyase n=1 Tax=Periconia macrospinosa TaxID=97972 RepID=A0A2V1DBJ1_9PLEO|nr:tryptophan synthase beta subunit-like PLP-dependent enzyme [Periconia macrospinosa]
MAVKDSLQSSQEQARPWVETPLRESYALSQAAGCRIFLKLENLQPSGSFKSRGIGNYILRRLAELPKNLTTTPHIFCSSGGNAGLAAVHASRTLNLPCTVVLPTTIKPLMVAKIKAAGAYDVLQHGAAWADADRYMREEVMPLAGASAIYTPPFDHPDIWAGNSTVMHEIAAQMPDGSLPDVIICSVGGGGLLNGVMQALDTLPSPHSPSPPTIIGLETAGADSMHASVKARSLVTLPEITSQATSLGCARVTRQTLDYALRPNVISAVLPDAEAAMGCWRLADDEGMMVELACGVNVALCYDGRLERVLGRKLRGEEKVVVVLCGGSNVTVDMLAGWRREFGYLEEGRGAAFENKAPTLRQANGWL